MIIDAPLSAIVTGGVIRMAPPVMRVVGRMAPR